jgi:thioesterase domain-containing protein
MEKIGKMELTHAQYETLLKLVALGGWMAQGGESGTDETIEDLQQVVLSHARDFGKSDIVKYDDELESFELDDKVGEEFTAHIAEYEEENFWDQLIFRLANRDAVKDMEDKGLSDEAAYEKFEEYVAFYETEFDDNGLDNFKAKS